MSEKLPPLPPLDKPVPHPWEAWPVGAFPVANERAELVQASLCDPIEPVVLVRMQLCDPTPPAKEEQADEEAKVTSDVR